MIVVHLGFNDRLQDSVDLREVVDLNRIEVYELYDCNDAFDDWIRNVHPVEEK